MRLYRLKCFAQQHFRDSVLKFAGDNSFYVVSKWLISINNFLHCSFESGKREIKVTRMKHRARQFNIPRTKLIFSCLFCKSGNMRAAGIGKSEHARNLVECLAYRIVACLSYNFIFQKFPRKHELRMPARNQQAQYWKLEIGN